ncbi:hypothetical protein KR215_005021, partial [Drosophila sulfurigaster]
INKYLHINDNSPIDPVVAQLPFMGSPWPVSFLSVLYLLIVLKYGKRYMEHRKAYDIKKIIIFYNLFQVIYNFLMFAMLSKYNRYLTPNLCLNLPLFFTVHFYTRVYDLRCITTFPHDHPYKYQERMFSYIYVVNKMIDLLDTIFFVLRKSYKQITVLHVYHHVLMVFLPYWVIRLFGTGGQFASMALFNTFVHAVMYFYYMISAIYPELKGSLWWKKYITKLQLFQFVTVMIHSVYILIFNPSCEYPKYLHYVILILGSIFIALFTNFYIQAYIRPQRVKPKSS